MRCSSLYCYPRCRCRKPLWLRIVRFIVELVD
jgi:hypothetical protein